MPAELVTARTAADRLGCTTASVYGWIRRAKITKEADGRFDFVELVAAKDARAQARTSLRGGRFKMTKMPAAPVPGSLEFEAARTRRLQADMIELKIASKRGELVRLDVVVDAVREIMAAARSNLLGIPARVAQEIQGLTDPVEIKRILLDRITASLDGIATECARLAEIGTGPSSSP